MKKITLSLLLLFSVVRAIATSYYVDPINGNDSNNGQTNASAFRSLSKIESISLQPGDIVYFMNGTYTRPGQTLLTINESGTADNWITFRNYPNHKPIFEFDSWTGIDVISGSSYIKFDGLTIKGARTKVNLEDALNQPAGCEADLAGSPQGLYNGTGILVVGPNLTWSNSATTTVPHHITVTNCEIYDCTSSGVAFQQADYVTITNNKIYDNCWYTIYGTSGINLYQFVNTDGTTGFHNTVTNNLLYGNQLVVPQVPYCAFYDGNGFIIDDFNHTQSFNYKDASVSYDAYSAKTLIANNVSVENGGSGLHFFLSSNCYVLNNTIVNNAFQNNGSNGNGDIRIGRCSDFVIKNNIIKGENSVHRNATNSNIDYSHNYHFGPNIQTALSNCDECIEDIDIAFLNTDVNSTTPYITDFTSMLKDAGITLTEINDDFSNQPRPNGDAYDIGAYELTDENPCDLITWYADFDGDNLGDINDTLLACEQPEDYVANSGDLCPNDELKTEPGECGCGEVEGTCETPPNEICNSPDYNHSTVYATADTIVIYDGKAYTNHWYASGIYPSSGGPWELIGFCDTPASDCTAIQNWSSSSTYANAGNQVVYNGFVYQNKWHASGSTPDESSAWELIGYCGESTSARETSSIVKIKANDIFEVSVYNLAGQLLTSKVVNSVTLNTVTNNANFAKGIYILSIKNTTTGLRQIKKIIK